MLIVNVTGNYFLKENDTATEIHLAVQEVDGTPVDLSTATRVEVVIGTLEGRYLTKTPTLLDNPGEFTFGLDEGDMLPVGDNLLEIYIYDANNEKRVAPSKGHYKLKVQQSIGSLGMVVTTYTLDYFLSEVNRITYGLPELMNRVEESADRMDDIIGRSESLVVDAESALDSARLANAAALEAANTIIPVVNDALRATSQANEASDNANNAAALVNDMVYDLLGYNIAISNFSLGTTYIKHQAVRANGSTYRAKVETQGNPLPVAPATSNEWFELVAEKGAKGDRGERGEKGETGDTGPKGEQGSGVNILGELTDPSQLPAVGTMGDAYMIGGNLWVWAEAGNWIDVGNIKGPVGPQGPAGSDANVTAVNIEGALGYVPASSNTLAALDTEVKNHQDRRDNPHAVTKDQVGLSNVQNYGLATQAEAEAGASTSKYMTPLRTKQAVDKVTASIIQSVTDVDTKVNSHAETFIAASKFGTTKNSTMIQAALNFAKGLGGGVVYVAPGTYIVTEIIRVPSNVKLIAMGKVVLKRMGEIAAIMHNDADGVKGNYDATVNIDIVGFTFDSNNTEFTSSTTALAIGHASDVLIENCEFLNCTSWHDLEINGSKHVKVKGCVFPNYQGTSEILQPDYMGSASQFPWFGPYNNNPCLDITLEDCRFYGDKITQAEPRPTRINLRAVGKHSYTAGAVTHRITFINCYFEGFVTAIYMQDTEDMTFENCHWWDCMHAITWEEKLNTSKHWVANNCTYRHSPAMFNSFDQGIDDCRFIYGATNNPTNFLNDLVVNSCLLEASAWNIIGGTFHNVKITNNVLRYSRGNGIYMYGGTNIVIADNVFESNNRLNNAGRADIVIGNNANVAGSKVIVKGNIFGTMINGSNVTNAIYTDNFINTSLTGISGSAVAKNNFIAGVWTP